MHRGVRLQPACSALIAGKRLPALRNQAPDLYTLDAHFATDFSAAAQIFASSHSAEPLWALLRGRCADFSPDSLIERAVVPLDAADGDLRIAELAQRLGIAPRTLQSRFLAAVGMTAKEHARVRRLQALLRSLDVDDANITDAAALT